MTAEAEQNGDRISVHSVHPKHRHRRVDDAAAGPAVLADARDAPCARAQASRSRIALCHTDRALELHLHDARVGGVHHSPLTERAQRV